MHDSIAQNARVLGVRLSDRVLRVWGGRVATRLRRAIARPNRRHEVHGDGSRCHEVMFMPYAYVYVSVCVCVYVCLLMFL